MPITVESNTEVQKTVAQAMGDIAKPVEETEKKSASADAAEAKSEDETAEVSEATDATEGDEQESKDEDSESDDEKLEAKPKRKTGYQRKIDKLTRRAADAQRDAAYWREQAMKTRDGAGEQKQEQSTPKVSATDKPNADNFDTQADFIEALADWKTEQKLKQREAEHRENQVKTEAQKRSETFAEKVESFKVNHDDWDDVMEDIEDIPISIAVREVILSSEKGPELAYALAKNRDEYARICKLPALDAAVELGLFKAKHLRAVEAKEEVKTTKAPKPLKPVTSKSAAGKKSIFDADLTQAEYEALRREQMKTQSSWG